MVFFPFHFLSPLKKEGEICTIEVCHLLFIVSSLFFRLFLPFTFYVSFFQNPAGACTPKKITLYESANPSQE